MQKVSLIITVLILLFAGSQPALAAFKDEKVEKFLNLPSAVEKFKDAESQRSSGRGSQTSPLVKESQAFAFYLDPPASVKRPSASGRKATSKRRPKGPVSAKFKLIGTCYYSSHPELSLALINEPGKGLRWVRQSKSIGHLILKEVKDGIVVVQDGQNTFDLKAERKPYRSLLKNKASKIDNLEDSALTGRQSVTGISNDLQLGDNSRRKAALKRIMTGLEDVNPGDSAPDDASQRRAEAKKALMEKILSGLEGRVSSGEAQKLGNLGEELKENATEPNRVESKQAKPSRKSPKSSRPRKSSRR